MRVPRSARQVFQGGLFVLLIAQGLPLVAGCASRLPAAAAAEYAAPSPGAPGLPPDLALVPPDAIAFAHVRLAELWNNEVGEQWREQLEEMFAEMLPNLGKEAGLTLADVQRLTSVLPASAIDQFLDDNGLPPQRSRYRGPDDDSQPVTILALGKAYDPAKVLRLVGAQPIEQKCKGKTYFVASAQLPNSGNTFRDPGMGQPQWAIHLATDRVLLLGPVASVRRVLGQSARANPQGPLAAALAQVDDRSHAIAGVQLPEYLANNLRLELSGPEAAAFRPFFDMQVATLTLKAGKESQLRCRLAYADETAAKTSQKGLKEALGLLRLHVHEAAGDQRVAKVAQFLKQVETALKMSADEVQQHGQVVELSVRTSGDLRVVTGAVAALTKTVPPSVRQLFGQPPRPVFATMASGFATAPLRSMGTIPARRPASLAPLPNPAAKPPSPPPPVQPENLSAEEAFNHGLSKKRLRQLGIAMHNYHSDFGKLPPPAIYSKDGKPLLSWRVALLPYLEQSELYKEFKLDEPWDSEHNKRLLEKMPKDFTAPGVTTKEPHTTFYQVFVSPKQSQGPKAMFEENGFVTLAQVAVQDGNSNTLMIVEAGKPVPWTKPEDLPYEHGKPLPKLGGADPAGFHACMGDCAVFFVKKEIYAEENVLRAIITRNGGENVDFRRFLQ